MKKSCTKEDKNKKTIKLVVHNPNTKEVFDRYYINVVIETLKLLGNK